VAFADLVAAKFALVEKWEGQLYWMRGEGGSVDGKSEAIADTLQN
jgi:hypothetical protein